MEYSQKNLFPCQQTIIAEISVIRQNQLPKTSKKFYTEMKVKTTSSLTSFTISSLILARSTSLPLSRSTSLFFLRPTSPFTSSDLDDSAFQKFVFGDRTVVLEVELKDVLEAQMLFATWKLLALANTLPLPGGVKYSK